MMYDIRTKKLDEDYVHVTVPVRDNNNGIKGYLLLLSELQDIEQIKLLLRKTVWICLLIASLFAQLMGTWFSRSLTRPLHQLAQQMRKFRLHEPLSPVRLKSRDEVAELAVSFQNMAEDLKLADERQKRLLQNASHELKSPLMAIQAHAEAIKDRVVEGEEQEQSLQIIVDECQSLKRLVDELLLLTRLENAEEAYRFEMCTLIERHRGQISALSTFNQGAGAHFRIQLPSLE